MPSEVLNLRQGNYYTFVEAYNEHGDPTGQTNRQYGKFIEYNLDDDSDQLMAVFDINGTMRRINANNLFYDYPPSKKAYGGKSRHRKHKRKRRTRRRSRRH